MIRELVHDEGVLSLPSEAACSDDIELAQDLLDTLKGHKETCVGMAANMIGAQKCIIAFLDESGRTAAYVVMFNPEIVKCDGAYEAQEKCLSLLGGPRKAKRYRTIKVKYQNERMQLRFKTYTGWTAQIIQHEIDHCRGILI